MIRLDRIVVAAAFAAGVITVGVPVRDARADGKNEIRSVTFQEDTEGGGATTRIRIKGAQTPTFTVYKLERPSRVVVDVPQARLAEAMRGHESGVVYTASTWAVSTISAQQLDDGGQVVRVMVTLARPGRYDVKTDGNEVVVMVSARDPAPKNSNPEALRAAEAKIAAAQSAAANAQAEAERLRKAAAEQTAKAEAAQRAADEAKRTGAQANAADLARAKAAADAAKADAARAREEAARATTAATTAQADAQRAKDAALADAARARREADQAKETMATATREAAAAKDVANREAAAARQATEQARQAEAARDAATKEAVSAKQAADQARAAASREADAVKKAAAREADAAKQDVARMRAEAEAAKQDAARVKAEAAAAQAATAQQIDAAQKAKAEADNARREADAARAEAARIRASVARTKTEAETARREADAARNDAARTKADAEAAQRAAEAARRDAAAKRLEADTAKSEIAKVKADARTEVAQAKADAAHARAEADASRVAADAARHAAAEDKKKAEADRKSAELARAQADRTMQDAKAQLAALDTKAQAAQALEDKARAASAAASAREDAAREAEKKAVREREQAQLAAKAAAERASDAAKKSSGDAAAIAAEARAAEQRLAAAKRATDEAEAKRRAAETAATTAQKELETTRTSLASVQKQRAAAETAAGDAARKRSEAEAAATDATRRRSEAEVAAIEAAKKRRDAEQAADAASEKRSEAERERLVADQRRRAAEEAAAAAKSAAEAADQQRKVAEAAVRTANDAKKQAESSLAELNTKRVAAERAASDLEARSKAEAKAQAELAAAQARKAGEAELAKVRSEVARLETERRSAETALADRRKAVAAQQAEAARLETTAQQARDSAARAEARRVALADQAKRPAVVAATRADDAKASTRAKADDPKLAKDVKAPGKADDAKLAKDVKAPARADDAKAAKADAKKPAGKPGIVNDIAFKGSVDGSAQVDIAMTGDAKVSLGEVTATHVELIVDSADLGANRLERKLDVSRFGSPVRAVSSFRDRRVPGRVRMIAELAQPATPTLDRDASGVHWRFVAQDAASRGGKRTASKATPIPTPMVGGFGAASTPVAQQSVAQLPPQASRRRVYRGATVDFDFVNANIHDLLRVISDTGRVNIVVPDTVDAKVTVRLKRVPWDQALEVILASKGLWYRREGNLIRVADRKDLDKEDELEAARRAALVQAEVPRPEIVPLNYASAKDLPAKLKGMLSPKGSIEVDDRTNSLIVTDVAGNREQIARLALLLDLQTPQVAIEARIVEARSTFVRQFGVQWGGRALAGAAGGNATGLVFPSALSVRGGNEDAQTVRGGIGAEALPSDFAINLPAATGSGEGGALGLALGSIGGNFAINLRLSALEDSGTVRIISAPKVTVLNNKKASIKQGVSIPISVISAAGTQTQFVQADLSLEVTPSVSTRDCTITMDLRVEKNEPDFVNVGARGDPTILRKEAVTSMLVADGETSVLGGIYTRNSGLAYKKFPFLAEIPVFGWLFKNRRENDDRTEILVFITPKITNRQLLRCQ